MKVIENILLFTIVFLVISFVMDKLQENAELRAEKEWESK